MQDIFIFISEQWLLVSALLALIYLLIFRQSQMAGKALSCSEVTQMLNRDEAILVDIRDSKDFKQGHISGAIHILFSDIDKRSDELKKNDKPLILVDKMGQMTTSAAKKFQQHGFSTLRLKGGIMEWQGNNLPLIK